VITLRGNRLSGNYERFSTLLRVVDRGTGFCY
jgi:hypothetical protein